jgi:hypothetical protein
MSQKQLHMPGEMKEQKEYGAIAEPPKAKKALDQQVKSAKEEAARLAREESEEAELMAELEKVREAEDKGVKYRPPQRSCGCF